MPRQDANCAFIVSTPTPLCSMSYRMKSAPAALTICARLGVKNSNAMVPKAAPPAASFVFTGLGCTDGSPSGWSAGRKLRRLPQRFEHAALVGLPRARDVERGAVVHRGAQHRQPGGDVHAGVEGDRLHRPV